MTDNIPDEIMREADRIYGQLGRGVASDVTAIARALMARDQRAAEIALAHGENSLDGQYWAGVNQAAVSISNAILSILEATPPAPMVTECATEGCAQAATVRFERGGVGSDYCHDCYMCIQALRALASGESR